VDKLILPPNRVPIKEKSALLGRRGRLSAALVAAQKLLPPVPESGRRRLPSTLFLVTGYQVIYIGIRTLYAAGALPGCAMGNGSGGFGRYFGLPGMRGRMSKIKDKPTATCATSEPHLARARSAVTRGKRLHVVAPGDTAWSRRFADVLAQIIADIGGPDGLSEAQRQLARRCATISIACERMEGEATSGQAINVEVYGTLVDRLGRAFGRIGIKRQARDIGPAIRWGHEAAPWKPPETPQGAV
jgi:hypothetical protein